MEIVEMNKYGEQDRNKYEYVQYSALFHIA